MNDAEKKIAEAFRKCLDESLARTCTTATEPVNSGTLTPDKVEQMVNECRRLKFNLDRTAVTVVVAGGHEGPIYRYEIASQGTFFEMDITTAQRLHEERPMVLEEVIDEGTAHFRPVHGFDLFVPKVLPVPPYEIAKDEGEKE